MQVYQLTYQSKSITDLNLEILNTILEESIARNSTLKITGCLIYFNGHFIQILEGEKQDVIAVYEKIITDKRHHQIELLWENDSQKRYFENWNMGFFSPKKKVKFYLLTTTDSYLVLLINQLELLCVFGLLLRKF